MTFPVLWQGSRHCLAELERLGCPRTVPLALVAPHEAQAMRNHGGQTLARLAERGGLAPEELVCTLLDRPLQDMRGHHPCFVVTLLQRLLKESATQ